MNTKAIQWVRTNLVLVIIGAVTLVALVGLPLLSRSLNRSITGLMQSKLADQRSLEGLERTQVSLTLGGLAGDPPTQIDERAVVNAALIDRLRTVSDRQRADADEIFRVAVDHNRRSHGLLYPGLFADGARDIIPMKLQFHRALVQAYDELMTRVRAGDAPSPEMLREDLERRRRQFLTVTLQKAEDAALSPEEQVRLSAHLAEARVALMARAAEDISFYASRDILAIPRWDQTRDYSRDELFQWQWDLWLATDILEALAEANARGGTVLRGPVKRIVSMRTLGPRVPARGGAAAGGAGGLGGMGMGGGAPETGEDGTASEPGGTPPDPDSPVPTDYTAACTGRISNSLYDVIDVELELIVDAAMIPHVTNAFPAQNFMTVVGLALRPVDPVADLRAGFVYGTSPVVQVRIRLETIWLRPWTVELMPTETRTRLRTARAQREPVAEDAMTDDTGMIDG